MVSKMIDVPANSTVDIDITTDFNVDVGAAKLAVVGSPPLENEGEQNG